MKLAAKENLMAVASGRASRVLARPLFRRLNVHMRTLNTREVIRIRTSTHHRATDKSNLALRFGLLDDHSLLQQSLPAARVRS